MTSSKSPPPINLQVVTYRNLGIFRVVNMSYRFNFIPIHFNANLRCGKISDVSFRTGGSVRK